MPVERAELGRLIEQKLGNEFGVVPYHRISGAPDPNPPWTDLTLEGDWTAFGNQPQYRVQSGLVVFRGDIFLSGGTASAGNPFDMPEVFDAAWNAGIVGTNGSFTLVPWRLTISNTTSGTVSVSPTPDENTNLHLDGLQVRVGD